MKTGYEVLGHHYPKSITNYLSSISEIDALIESKSLVTIMREIISMVSMKKIKYIDSLDMINGLSLVLDELKREYHDIKYPLQFITRNFLKDRKSKTGNLIEEARKIVKEERIKFVNERKRRKNDEK